MNRTEIERLYPTCAAVALFFEDPQLMVLWDHARRANEGPAATARILRGAADKTLALHPGIDLADCRNQMDDPAFARYVAGKLGCY